MARRSRDPYGRDSAPASPGDGRINAPLGAAPSSVPTRRLSSASLVSVPTLPSYRSRQKDDSTDSDASIDSRDDEKAVAAREQEPLVGYLAEEHRTGDDGSWRPGRTAKVSASGKSRSGALEELLATVGPPPCSPLHESDRSCRLLMSRMVSKSSRTTLIR